KPCEKRRLVLLTLAADEIRLRALPPRPLELVPLDADVELRQVRTREVVREVGGREPERAVGGEAHVVGVSAARRHVLRPSGMPKGPPRVRRGEPLSPRRPLGHSSVRGRLRLDHGSGDTNLTLSTGPPPPPVVAVHVFVERTTNHAPRS